jgi:uncharacterized PurR-regulated membrane protein YhhQ (DUF165 family)
MWGPFAAMVGGAAAGLASLIFLVVAFRFDTIATSREYRNRAAQVLVLFLTTTIAAALVVAPQDPRLLGVELLIAAGTAGTLLVVLDRAARGAQQTQARWPAVAGMLFTLVALAGAGMLLIAGIDAGLYAYAAAGVAALIFGVNGAWVFLTRAGVASGTADR